MPTPISGGGWRFRKFEHRRYHGRHESEPAGREDGTGREGPEDQAGRAPDLGDAEDGGRLRTGHGPAVHPLHLRQELDHISAMPGRAVAEYRAPLFFAWQLTNRCGARCITCCEESGPDRAWRDELSRAEAL